MTKLVDLHSGVSPMQVVDLHSGVSPMQVAVGGSARNTGGMRCWVLRFAAVLALAVGVLAPTAAVADPPRRVAIRVDQRGFHPSTVEARQGERITLVITRVSERGCGTEVVVPSRDIRRPLPLNEPVEVTLRLAEAGRLAFTCGMGHMRGAVVVRESD